MFSRLFSYFSSIIKIPCIKTTPKFATGPTQKYRGYSLNKININLLGRSHRSNDCVAVLNSLVFELKEILNIPKNYEIILTPASDSGAFEIALWNLIGLKNTDCLSWDHFGYMWEEDLKKLIPNKLNIFRANWGDYPNLVNVDFLNNDVVFTLCGTSSGVIFNDFDKIPNTRKGLIIADATSYIFGNDIPWSKLDALTFSWQKALGGEAGFGVLVLSPRAIERINTYNPSWVIPHIFNIKQNNKFNMDLTHGNPINTISMLCVLDYLHILKHFKSKGGLLYCINKVKDNYQIVMQWLDKNPYFQLLSQNINNSSNMAICLQIVHPIFLSYSPDKKESFVKNLYKNCELECIGHDIASYKKAPLGVRFWIGPTIETKDIKNLVNWLNQYINTHAI